jgi:transcription-repair coupling factor (superfamily II helicase)
MNSILKVVPNVKKYNDYLFDINKGKTPIMLSGLTDTAKAHMAYSTKFYTDKPVCIITHNEMQVKKLKQDFKFFEDHVRVFPKRDVMSFDFVAESKDVLHDRISTLNDIIENKVPIIITTVEAAMQKMIPKTALYKNLKTLKTGDEISLESLKNILISLGYERYDLIEGKGQFSVRGGIVDIATSRQTGIRIEFWGDEIESIRDFNILTQRSTDNLKEITLYPAYEFLLNDSIENICDRILSKPYIQTVKEKVLEDVEEIKAGEYLTKIDKYFNDFYPEADTLLDYLKENTVVFLDEIEKIKTRAENISKDNEHLTKDLIEKKRIVPQLLCNMEDYYSFCEKLETRQVVYLEKQDIGFVDKQSMHAKRNGYSFSYREVNFFRSSMDLLFKELQEAINNGKTTVVLGGSPENMERISEVLAEHDLPSDCISLDDELALGRVNILPGALSAGFENYDMKLYVVSLSEIFEVKKKRKRVPSSFKEGETIIFADLKPGDYIVHKTHGIGVYLGVNTIRADGITKDYIKLKYKDDDILYVPTDSLDNIRKFIGSEGTTPKINKLGSKEWEKTTSKVKSNLREVAEELIKLYAIRQKSQGFAFSSDTAWQKEFEDSFPYEETADQLRCIEEVKKDMEAPKPMDRLLCGDVGYGKTEVAIRAAFKACMDQKQIAYLAPTTILSQQQYESFKERMKDYPIRIEVLNRFKSAKEQKDILKRLELGEVDIVIGTHRLLSKDVIFKNLGLLIIDEEHRFGVKAKEKIKEYKTNVDVLTMTATPIPRTLNMSIVGMRDMSVIYEPPQNRKPVQTYVLEYDDEVIKEAITKELERDGQVFYLYNQVETISQKANYISTLVPESKVAFAHGQMTGSELEDIMEKFVLGEVNVLVCTTILESGIDIPNANTIIVENADRLGLAQLYQIRGRVGRSERQAYSYITYKRSKMLSDVADKRLKAIKEFTEFGSGFKIAMRDLEIRGAGSLMGEMQHGHMSQVGYDMYCKLLDEVVKEIKGEEIPLEGKDVQIDLNVSSYIPDDYISDSSQKIDIYQDIAICKTEEDIAVVIDSLKDRFGYIPREIDNLLDITRIKNLARAKNVLKIAQKGNNIVYNFDGENFDMDIVSKLITKFKNRIKFSPSINPYLTYNLNGGDVLEEVKNFLEVL